MVALHMAFEPSLMALAVPPPLVLLLQPRAAAAATTMIPRAVEPADRSFVRIDFLSLGTRGKSNLHTDGKDAVRVLVCAPSCVPPEPEWFRFHERNRIGSLRARSRPRAGHRLTSSARVRAARALQRGHGLEERAK
jgi:hypothetical protein